MKKLFDKFKSKHEKIDCPYCDDGTKLHKIILGGVYYCAICHCVFDRYFTPTKRTTEMLDEKQLQAYNKTNDQKNNQRNR